MNILDELRREFPGIEFKKDEGGDVVFSAESRHGPVQARISPSDDVHYPWKVVASYPNAVADDCLKTAADAVEWATGIDRPRWSGEQMPESKSASTGTVIDAEVPREYDNGDPETEADKASFAEFARLAPFRKTWPEWTWSSPDADTYIGEVDGETWTCQREPGDSFRAHSSLCSAVCYHEDAYQAMRAMMVWPEAERSAPRKSDATQVRPAHYGGTSNPYECIKVIRAWGLNFELGNVAKYLSRAGKKPGVEAVDDLRKLITYAQMEIERLEEANGNH